MREALQTVSVGYVCMGGNTRKDLSLETGSQLCSTYPLLLSGLCEGKKRTVT